LVKGFVKCDLFSCASASANLLARNNDCSNIIDAIERDARASEPKHKTTSPLSPDRSGILPTAGRQIKLRAGMQPAENAHALTLITVLKTIKIILKTAGVYVLFVAG